MKSKYIHEEKDRKVRLIQKYKYWGDNYKRKKSESCHFCTKHVLFLSLSLSLSLFHYFIIIFFSVFETTFILNPFSKFNAKYFAGIQLRKKELTIQFKDLSFSESP